MMLPSVGPAPGGGRLVRSPCDGASPWPASLVSDAPDLLLPGGRDALADPRLAQLFTVDGAASSPRRIYACTLPEWALGFAGKLCTRCPARDCRSADLASKGYDTRDVAEIDGRSIAVCQQIVCRTCKRQFRPPGTPRRASFSALNGSNASASPAPPVPSARLGPRPA